MVFLLDVDNTLLDNDAIARDISARLRESCGVAGAERYWDIFERLRHVELGYADYFGALQRLRSERPNDVQLLEVGLFLLQYPFADRVYPGAVGAIAALQQRGRVVILSDGDVVYQPHKVERSGLWSAVKGHVLIYIHKEEMLDDIERRYPARRYVMVDDKLRILAAMKPLWPEKLTTVFVRQGHYANDPALAAAYPPADVADVSIDRIADLPRALEEHVVAAR